MCRQRLRPNRRHRLDFAGPGGPGSFARGHPWNLFHLRPALLFCLTRASAAPAAFQRWRPLAGSANRHRALQPRAILCHHCANAPGPALPSHYCGFGFQLRTAAKSSGHLEPSTRQESSCGGEPEHAGGSPSPASPARPIWDGVTARRPPSPRLPPTLKLWRTGRRTGSPALPGWNRGRGGSF